LLRHPREIEDCLCIYQDALEAIGGEQDAPVDVCVTKA
jgi:hypothetical protein